MSRPIEQVDAWYNLSADLDFTLPHDIVLPTAGNAGPVQVSIPLALVRQERNSRRWHEIPDDVAKQYATWRPTPLRRALQFERAIGTRSRIYIKYEGGNISGSHKLNTAVAQAHFYAQAGARHLVVGTGAGQWGTAIAAACSRLGMDCTVFMVRSSRKSKPHRATLMRMLGAKVVDSPSELTGVGRAALQSNPDESGSLAMAIGEARILAREAGASFCTGSGEGYALLHQTIIGLESMSQLNQLGDEPDVVTACVGGGSNFGGLTFPFLGPVLRSGSIGPLESAGPKFVAAEPAACPTLTRGRYAYDFADASRSAALQKMFTLGHDYVAPELHAGGLRYHGNAKLISALLDRKLIAARAYSQAEVFETARIFLLTEGILPAPESAHALHSARREASILDDTGGGVVLTCISGHGLLDLAGYQQFLDGGLSDLSVDDEIARSLSRLPDV